MKTKDLFPAKFTLTAVLIGALAVLFFTSCSKETDDLGGSGMEEVDLLKPVYGKYRAELSGEYTREDLRYYLEMAAVATENVDISIRWVQGDDGNGNGVSVPRYYMEVFTEIEKHELLSQLLYYNGITTSEFRILYLFNINGDIVYASNN